MDIKNTVDNKKQHSCSLPASILWISILPSWTEAGLILSTMFLREYTGLHTACC